MTRRQPVLPNSRPKNEQILVSVIVPVYNSGSVLPACLKSVRDSTFLDYECIVVDDASTDGSAEIAQQHGAFVISVGWNRGPAHARNVGSSVAKGEILLFIDADVCVHPDAMSRAYAAFAADAELTAVIGSYDDAPMAPDFLSRYRNLLHCYVHRHAKRRVSTFWSGCGAIRRDAFLEQGGFDESYERPSIEDIELGYRLTGAGKKVMLDPRIMVKHLKYWSFASMVRTDVGDRGIPWTELILRSRTLPNDLNLKLNQRASVALAVTLIPAGLMALGSAGSAFLVPVFAALFLLFGSLAAALWQRQHVSIFVVMGAVTCALSALHGAVWVAPILAAAIPLLGWRKRTGRSALSTAVYAMYALAAIATLLWQFGDPGATPFYGCVAGLITLNCGFYRFLAVRMGLLEGMTAIPFHILFHFYSGLAFGAGVVRYLMTFKAAGSASERVPKLPAQEVARSTAPGCVQS